MKIAIFGDSYAAGHLYDRPDGYEPWPVYLQNMTDHDITNYAISGSSFQYSAQLFLKDYSQYDKIIFVITSPGRMYISNPLLHDNRLRHVAGLTHIEWLWNAYSLNRSEKMAALPYIDAAKSYYTYLYDHEQAKLFHTALYEKLERTTPPGTVLWLPVIACSVGKLEGTVTTLNDISMIDGIWETNQMDDRCDHFNDNNNRLLAEKINRWIETGDINLNVSEFKQADPSQQLWRPL